MKRPQIRFCTLAVGYEYRAMARRLASDLERFAPGHRLLVGTDRGDDFRDAGNVSVVHVAASGRWACYNAKRLVLHEALLEAEVAIHVDADSRVVAPPPLDDAWAPGLNAPHENLHRHLGQCWPSWHAVFDEAARAIGVSSAAALWVGESIYALARDGGREFDFIATWGRLAELLAPRDFRGGEGNIMGLAAASAGLPVRWGRWRELDAARRHFNASRAPAGRWANEGGDAGDLAKDGCMPATVPDRRGSHG